ncbi:conserved hypothetical protein [Tenacibaculum sp. 190524A02b]|uniref:YD repeat-containing protein n=1 Tax=Tenacibaculum vairaonense TaxID=3137860 RepID=A0ABP1FEE4_9FLAO
MKRVLLSIFTMLVYVVGYGQDLPTIVPPSPEATSLAKFTEIPVSHYTGLPTIGVPLYEIDFEGLKIPIGLSYHARGIKVEEIASRVGIGWALNAGGAITRQIRDKDDFGGVHKGYLKENYYSDFFTNPATRLDVATKDVAQEMDLVPDQFIFNFLGYSGKFIFDQKTKEAVLQSYDDIKIQMIGDSNSDSYFIVTTSNGFQFYFGSPHISMPTREAKSYDETLNNYQSSDGDTGVIPNNDSTPSVNTWHLIDIVSPNGKKVSFNYKEETTNFYRRSYDKKNTSTKKIISFFAAYRGHQYQLEEIIFDQGKVTFVKDNNEREDLEGAYALSSVEVENTNKRVLKYNFNYSYSNDNSSSNMNNYLFSNEPKAGKRLFLDTIQLIGNNDKSELYRSFEYTNKSELPNRFSNEQDYWGYYNGKANGPYLTDFGTNGYLGDRTVDIEKANVGLIKKINYPTGGYTTYTFEANKAIMPDYFKDLYFANPNPKLESKYAYVTRGEHFRTSYGKYESESFTINEEDIGPIDVRVSFGSDGANCILSSDNNYQIDSSCKYRVSIVHENGSDVLINNIPLQLFSTPINEPNSIPIEYLPPGSYKIRVEVSGIDNPNDDQGKFGVYLNWHTGSSLNNLIYSGGNRIQKIENYSVDSGKITRTFEYLINDRDHIQKGEKTSSGLLFSLPSYYYITSTTHLANGTTVSTLGISGARPGSPMTYEQGNHVGYSHVTEYIDTDNTKGLGGKTTYEFTAIPDQGNFYEYPYTLPVNNEWLRGKPLLIRNYKKDATSLDNYSIIKQEEYTYKYADELPTKSLSNPELNIEPTNSSKYLKDRLKFSRPLITYKRDEYFKNAGGGNTHIANPEDYKVYFLSSGVQKLFRKQETTYNTTGEIITSTDYLYDYDKHYQLAGSEVTNSKDEVLQTVNTYPAEGSRLHDEHRIATPITVETYRKVGDQTSKISTQNTVYKDFKGFYLPEIIQAAKGNLGLEDRITYHDYDTEGNPTEVSKQDGTSITYLWGYDYTQPIAKIEGATYAQVMAALGKNSDHDLSYLQNYTESQLQAEMAKARTGLSNALVTSFTYKPLIGVSTVTDARGRVTSYHYDAFNRLHLIKDADGNILKENTYNYKNK